MSRQIAVRLPDEMVAFLDRAVAEGGRSRAALVASAVEREMRRLLAEHDAATLQRQEQQMTWTTWCGGRQRTS